MKGVLFLAMAAAGAVGCADNSLSISIQQMEAVSKTMMCVAGTSAAGGTVRDRGVLDLTLVKQTGYVAIPLVRNNLGALQQTGGVEFNAVQLIGANVALFTPAGAPAPVPAGQQKFFYPAAGGRLDPGGAAPMFIEVLPAAAAQALAGNIMGSGFYTVIAEVRPVGMKANDQVVGGAISFPIDLCSGCLLTGISPVRMCPLATAPGVGGCFPQQDDPIDCCTDSAGAVLCGAAAPVKTM